MGFRSIQALSVPFALALAPAATARDEAPARGVWREHQVTLSQLGFSVKYSCEGLAYKLKLLLRAAGARPDVRAVPIGCNGPGNPSSFARVVLTFHTLDPTAANGPVAGGWRSVSINTGSPRELAPGDCELVERFRDELLPLFRAETRVDRVRCVPHQHSGSYDLRFRVFAASRP